MDLLTGEIQPTLIVILPDINTPGMDGLQLLTEIKQRRPDLSVMMVTAYSDDEPRQRATALGAAQFLTKQVELRRLKGAPAPTDKRSGLNTCGTASNVSRTTSAMARLQSNDGDPANGRNRR